MRKFSEIKGKESMVVLAELVSPVASLAKDEEVMALFERKPIPKNKNAQAEAMDRLAKGLPPLMERHGDDFIKILAIVDGVTVEEYEEKMTLNTLISDFYTLMSDPAFRSFLS